MNDADESRLAVIGMAGRFPGAAGLEEFWENLSRGVESIRPLPVPEAATHQPAAGVLDDADCFDAGYFGYAPAEALIIDPQHRLFMECAVEALEHAGQDPSRFPGPIGVYAGSSQTAYLDTLRAHRDHIGGFSDFQLRLATGIDFLTTRAAYKLGLRGPAVTVQTACSTSLVAVHQAAQALLAGECDIALAGGASVHIPTYPGEYTPDGVLAADGHCRAFDAAADGTISGNAVGIVVLKRLDDAIADGDTVHAVVLATAVNNDGNLKIGFTAPSVDGQAEVMRTALEVADLEPDSIGYVEAHGTGTPLGDPIEIAALTNAYGTAREDVCWIGSVKTNIGHTDAAAGVTGFIKAVLALRHRHLPPSLHFTTPNPNIDFAKSPFRVNTASRPWDADGTPRRAAVNSLGLGGTNAHVILEEPPDEAPTDPGRMWQLVVLSARSRSALARARSRLSARLRRHPDTDLADLAWTTQVGRRAHDFRCHVVAADVGPLASMLEHPGDAVEATGDAGRCVTMLFPGQGGQRIGMARDLYETEPVYRAAFDECAGLFAPRVGVDLRRVLYDGPEDAEALAPLPIGHAAIFAVEIALHRLWTHWGVTPDSVAGHSLGAFAAAHVAGVFTLDDAVAVVATRARLIGGLPEGGMVAVPLPEARVAELLDEGLSIAAVNAPRQCVVSGARADVDRFAVRLRESGVDVRRLRIPAAGHSRLVDPIVDEFARFVETVPMREPGMPIFSDHTGQLLEPDRARDPAYWAAHLRGTVRFGDTVATILKHDDHTIVEAGPGRTLSTLVRRHPDFRDGHVAAASLSHPAEAGPDLPSLVDAVGQLWTSGHDIDWAAMHSGARRRRIPLPAYPFERMRFRVEPGADVPISIDTIGRERPEVAHVEAPAGATEATVAAAFHKILGVPEVGRRHDFFAMGGDSLLATQLTAWIHERFDTRVSVRAVFANPTVADLAAFIDRATADDPANPRSD
ncbi:MAG TPA: beta-ketoacyl synthase N-terminal-like domain-containing protein [Stackebrandtia sp.]|jgi:acyl transferase domain-containing protein|uniref:type I polyketide synthase n=1 Tax=Stackebrandtia sp. TaxID=2023065 RepID=UPI002D6CECC9|nr:beta-ketoacyl synthase N-terminal-like domain-containing protein [Stackebrandtia sp.]HZE39137.1 beta-ketoacyl synthase N-terminal-like domain-containing protein [Stackebrandtia sp.]